ncbi:MAG: ADP-ribose polymerase [Candidatus Pacearchaeota archaeon]|jgi:poly [ADP-ribose] polymerase
MQLKDYTVPGKKVVKLVCVTADNNNKYYNMFEQASGNFIVQYGRIKGTEVTHEYSAHEWDKIYRSKTKKGYEDMTHLFKEAIAEVTADAEANGETVTQAEIQNRAVKALFDKLMAYAKKTVQENYTVTQSEVTQAMVDEAQKIIDTLSKILTEKSAHLEGINNNLLKLYSIIPRKMSNVRDHLLSSFKSDADTKRAHKLMADEQAVLDTMAGQVELLRKQKEQAKANKPDAEGHKKSMDMLQTLGLEAVEANAQEIEIIKKMMGPNANQFRSAFRVTNRKTQEKFDAYVANAKDKKCELFWHGSRNENWFNILQSGLLIRPSGAVHTGSMFGDGIYGANKAQKSIGYTSLRGACWSGGSSSSAYLALFDFHVGNQKNITHHNSDCYTLNKQKLAREGFDSVYAHGGADLRNDEFIVYDAAQVTVKYIIEIAN